MRRLQLRVARADDWNALAEMRYRFRTELESPTGEKSRFVRRCRSWMRKRFCSDSYSWRCWVVDDGKQLLGHVCVELFEKMPNPVNEPELHAYVTNFYIVPELRNHSLGGRLLKKALSWCRAQGVDAIILWAVLKANRFIAGAGYLNLLRFSSYEVTHFGRAISCEGLW